MCTTSEELGSIKACYDKIERICPLIRCDHESTRLHPDLWILHKTFAALMVDPDPDPLPNHPVRCPFVVSFPRVMSLLKRDIKMPSCPYWNSQYSHQSFLDTSFTFASFGLALILGYILITVYYSFVTLSKWQPSFQSSRLVLHSWQPPISSQWRSFMSSTELATNQSSTLLIPAMTVPLFRGRNYLIVPLLGMHHVLLKSSAV